jgi:hypothetical protein
MFTYLLATSLLLFQPPPQVVQVSPTLEDYEKALDIFTEESQGRFRPRPLEKRGVGEQKDKQKDQVL